jgi:hypothetical protein
MKQRTTDLKLAVVDYSAARAQAIRWLGDRYLLAKPINAGRRTWPRLSPAVTTAVRST